MSISTPAGGILRLKQVLVIALGLLLAGGMVVAGRWQLAVYSEQGAAAAAQRAAEPPLPLLTAAPAGAPVADAYGHSVSFSGSYEADLQRLVPAPGGGFRVLTALRQSDGSTVAVVRGKVATASAPPPPSGVVQQTGLLLPSEADAGRSLPPGQLGSVRVPALAQEWPPPLVDGFVTLVAADAAAQRLEPDVVDLPSSGGRLRNGAYALQWWLFAAFTVAMAFRIARDLERGGLADAEIDGVVPSEPT